MIPANSAAFFGPELSDEAAAGAGEEDSVEAPVVVEEVLVDEEELSDFLPPELLYRSEYQPPPLRMKAPPPEIWRLALLLAHLGQVSRAASVMRCSTSQAWPQEVQAYS